MKKFETKNKFKYNLIFISFLLILQLVSLGTSIIKNLQVKQYGNIINDSYLYYDYKGNILNIIVLSIGFAIILIRLKKWKPKYIFFNNVGLKFIDPKKREDVMITFSEIKEIKFNSSKIVTSKGTFRFPILHTKNLSDLLINLKPNLNDDFSAKGLKQINNRITLDSYYHLWRKAIIPQILFFLIFFYVLYNIPKPRFNNISNETAFILSFSGILAAGFAEILRYLYFLKKFDINKIYNTKQRLITIWFFYGIACALWFFVIFVTAWLDK